MTFAPKYTRNQRDEAVALVTEIIRRAGRRHGAYTAAANQLGLSPSIVAHWASKDLPATTPAGPDLGPVPGGMNRLVVCGLCRRPMFTALAGEEVPVFVCGPPCRRTPVPVLPVAVVIGRMILTRLPATARPPGPALTAVAAAGYAPRFLDRITLGAQAADIRVRWKTRPVPAQANAATGTAIHDRGTRHPNPLRLT